MKPAARALAAFDVAVEGAEERFATASSGLSGLEREHESMIEREVGLVDELARVYLADLSPKSISRSLGVLRDDLATLLRRQEAHGAGLEARIEDKRKEFVDAFGELQRLDGECEKQEHALEARRKAVEEHLRSEPGYVPMREEHEAAMSKLDRVRARRAELMALARHELPKYGRHREFRYLTRRSFGSIPLSPFQAAPGDEYSYSNIAFGVLGLSVARATGRPFMELVREDVFHPLGMSSSTFVIDRELAPRLPAGYANRGQSIDAAFPAREHAGRGYKVPNGGVYSTVADLARFMGAIGGNAPMPILSDESRLEMMRVHTPEDPDAGYGLGLMVQKSPAGDWLVGHSGSVAGYSAYMVFEPETGLGVVMLRNYNQGQTNLGEVSRELLIELLDLLEHE